MRQYVFLFLTLFLTLFQTLCAVGAAGEPESLDLSYYLPADVSYDPSVPTPRSVLGSEVGEWHVRHDQLVQYMEALAAASPRVSIQEYARSHEGGGSSS